jgi:cytoskeletal protein CcmA (bactofilin family)
VVSKAKVIIGANGDLNGDLNCSEAAVEGKVKGNVTVLGLLRLNSSSRVEGEVNYKKIIIEEGAVIIGSLVTQSAISVPLNIDNQLSKSKDSTNKKIG